MLCVADDKQLQRYNDLESIRVQFIRFGYDIEKAAKAVENSLLPNEYAEMLRNGV